MSDAPQSQYPCSPHQKVRGIVYFARMADKIRLKAQGLLGDDYLANLGKGFDGNCASFLGMAYEEIARRILEGGSDEEVLDWCFREGGGPSESQIFVWNEYMRKCGWNDALTERLKARLNEGGFGGRTDIQTLFDYIDLDEGRL